MERCRNGSGLVKRFGGSAFGGSEVGRLGGWRWTTSKPFLWPATAVRQFWRADLSRHSAVPPLHPGPIRRAGISVARPPPPSSSLSPGGAAWRAPHPPPRRHPGCPMTDAAPTGLGDSCGWTAWATDRSPLRGHSAGRSQRHADLPTCRRADAPAFGRAGVRTFRRSDVPPSTQAP